MDDFDDCEQGNAIGCELLGWSISLEKTGLLKLGLKYRSTSGEMGEQETMVRVLLPPEAAIYLAEELNRRARGVPARSEARFPNN